MCFFWRILNVLISVSRDFLTTVANAAKDKLTLIAGINSLSTDHSIELAAQAKTLGYDGLMLSATPYSLLEQDGIIAHFEKVRMPVSYPFYV